MDQILLDKCPSYNSKLAVTLRAEEKKIIESYLEFCEKMEQAVPDELQQNETAKEGKWRSKHKTSISINDISEEKKVSEDLKDTKEE